MNSDLSSIAPSSLRTPHLPLPHESQGEVGEGGQVPTGSHRPLFWDIGQAGGYTGGGDPLLYYVIVTFHWYITSLECLIPQYLAWDKWFVFTITIEVYLLASSTKPGQSRHLL